jgi:hypothetical protein
MVIFSTHPRPHARIPSQAIRGIRSALLSYNITKQRPASAPAERLGRYVGVGASAEGRTARRRYAVNSLSAVLQPHIVQRSPMH